VSTYIPTAIDERAYEQAKKDALGAYSPQHTIMISGFLAGILATWLPGIIGAPFFYGYVRLFRVPRWEEAATKAELTKDYFFGGLNTYASVAIWLGIILGAYGILQALLRQRSCKNNKYITMEFARYGEVRLSIDAILTIIGIPIATIIYLGVTNMLSVLIVAIFIVVLSGMFYNGLWTMLFNLIIRILYRPGFDQIAALGLRVLIPRHVGWNQVSIDTVEVNRADKSVRIEGKFDSDFAEKEARNVVGHFLRGYHPIYIVNKNKPAS
jgi:hypothetical protein